MDSWDGGDTPTFVERFVDWLRGIARSGRVTSVGLVLLVAALAIAYLERGRGNLHKLEQKIGAEHEVQDMPTPKPGGQEAIRLERTQYGGTGAPEFLSVTMLPGRGLNMLQIRAFVPGRGEVSLLASPELEQAAQAMTGTGADADGRQSIEMGGAFEAPWAGRMWGSPGAAGRVNLGWRGHGINVPAAPGYNDVAENGLMLAAAADTANVATMPDGGQARATFRLGDFGTKWPSKTEVTVTILLSNRSIEMKMEARNVGDTAEPVGLGWHPRFALLDDRGQIRLRVPGMQRVEKRSDGQPTGKLLPILGTPFDLTSSGGVKLGTTALDECYTGLKGEFLDNGPEAELVDPAAGFGLRLTALTPHIHAMCVTSRPSEKWVLIEPRFNLDDPFGREWGNADTGMTVLEPGESAEWRVRLELTSPNQ